MNNIRIYRIGYSEIISLLSGENNIITEFTNTYIKEIINRPELQSIDIYMCNSKFEEVLEGVYRTVPW